MYSLTVNFFVFVPIADPRPDRCLAQTYFLIEYYLMTDRCLAITLINFMHFILARAVYIGRDSNVSFYSHILKVIFNPESKFSDFISTCVSTSIINTL